MVLIKSEEQPMNKPLTSSRTFPRYPSSDQAPQTDSALPT